MRRFQTTGTGYQAIQSTKPQSLAYGLNDSPVGLAAWIIEKFQSWSDDDITSAYTADRLLENLSIYWFTGTINSSMRLYHEAMSGGGSPFPDRTVVTPTGHAVFPGEIYPCPRVWAERQFRIVRWVVMPRGGHFAAMEVPELYVPDVLAFTRTVEDNEFIEN
jgi:epoxide hydrolase